MKHISATLIGLVAIVSSHCQDVGTFLQRDSIFDDSLISHPGKVKNSPWVFVKSSIIPAVSIAYGVMTIENHSFQQVDYNIRAALRPANASSHATIDNYLQFAPAAAVYALNSFGIKGKNNFRDRTIILAIAAILEQSTVRTLKSITHQVRPDGSNFRSFPSGHTSNAFAGAELLNQEYKHISPWYGISGYVVAVLTGGLRIYNNKHWFSDVVAGAGIGILSTHVAYRIYPWLDSKVLRHKRSPFVILPNFQSGSVGFAMIYIL